MTARVLAWVASVAFFASLCGWCGFATLMEGNAAGHQQAQKALIAIGEYGLFLSAAASIALWLNERRSRDH